MFPRGRGVQTKGSWVRGALEVGCRAELVIRAALGSHTSSTASVFLAFSFMTNALPLTLRLVSRSSTYRSPVLANVKTSGVVSTETHVLRG